MHYTIQIETPGERARGQGAFRRLYRPRAPVGTLRELGSLHHARRRFP